MSTELPSPTSTVHKLIRLAILAGVFVLAYLVVVFSIGEVKAEHALSKARFLGKTRPESLKRKELVMEAIELNPGLLDAQMDRAQMLVTQEKNNFRNGKTNLIDEEGLLQAYESLGMIIHSYDFQPHVYRLRGEMALLLSSFYQSQRNAEKKNEFDQKGFDDLHTAVLQLPRPRERSDLMFASLVSASQRVGEVSVAVEYMDEMDRYGERYVALNQRMLESNSRSYFELGLLPFQLREFQFGAYEEPNNDLWFQGLYVMAVEYGYHPIVLNTFAQMQKDGKLSEKGQKYYDLTQKALAEKGTELTPSP